jgi:rubrerythrin
MFSSDRILQYQYHAKNYQTYSDLVHDLLQAEKHDKLTLRNHHQCSIGSAPLFEVHYNVKSNKKGDGSKKQHKKFGKFRKGKHNGKNMVKGQRKGKGKTFICHKCGGPNHFVRKYRTPKYLVELYKNP